MGDILRLWEVPDNIPASRVDIVVGMTLPQARDGSCSNVLRDVVRCCAKLYLKGAANRVVYSNRFVAGGTNLALVAKAETTRAGVPDSSVTVPKNPWDPRIRNTVEEARFALRLLRLSKVKSPRMLVVANHLHMRRVLGAFRALIPQGRNVQMYWMSARDRTAYGADAAQDRFRHPLFFLAYELVAYGYSKVRGWA